MKKKIAPSSPSSGGGRKKKQKQPTQRPTEQTIVVLGPTGKRRIERRPW